MECVMTLMVNKSITKVFTIIYQGTGYKVGEETAMCSGCIILSCTSRPCVGRHGEKCKLFWNVTLIGEHCCKDCEGTVFPPNQALPPVSLHDECGTTEHAVCKELWHSGAPRPAIEVSYTATNCCGNDPVGTRVLEPSSCSFRTCTAGVPAFWERTYVHHG